MKKKIITLFILVMFLATHNTSAVTSSINSVIYGKETNSEYGHVLSYRNTGSEMLHREQGFSLANFYNDEKLLEYITLAPNDGIQSFEKGSVELMFQYNRQDSTLEKIREAGKLDFKFYVTLDGTTFNDATNQLVYNEATNTYKYNGDLKGYKLSFINKTDVHYLQEQIGFLISHGIKFNYENMNENQKAGKEKLASWLDSKEENIPPTGNYQNIYIIQPEIKGKIKYQDLNGTN
ncbi:MAG: hypothetical protein RR425_06600, partial [Erysipelotrichales bacterium]